MTTRPHRTRVPNPAMEQGFDPMPIIREVIDIDQWYLAELWAQERDAIIERELKRPGKYRG